jgi:predicted HTH transcriptional regulator
VENITLSKLTGAAHRIDKRLVDAQCLREVVINAFAHNDYSYGMLPIFEVFQNRFAIRSYGGLVPQLTINDFFLGVSALRNPELMRILKDVELVEALGFGIRGITKIYDKNIFEFTDNTLYVQLPFDTDVLENSKGESKGESKDEVLRLMKINSKITVSDIAFRTGLSISGVEKIIRQLKKESKIKRSGSTKKGVWVVLS